MDTESLKLIGLAKNDYKVYEAALRGNCSMSEICHETSIHRRNVYDCIHRLLKLGLLSFYEQNKKRFYVASPPDKIFDIIGEKKKYIEQTESKIISKIEKLKSLHVEKKNPFNVKVFVGKEGLKNVYNDILKSEKDYIGFGPGRQLEKIMKFYLHNFIKQRVRSGIRARQIYDESSRGFKYTKNPLLEVRYLSDESCSHAALRVYGHKTVIMLLDTKEPLAIMIEKKEIADGYRKYFEVLWKSAKP